MRFNARNNPQNHIFKNRKIAYSPLRQICDELPQYVTAYQQETIDYRARKSRVYIAWRYEIHAIIGSLGTVRVQPHFRSHVKSMGDFRLLQITVI